MDTKYFKTGRYLKMANDMYDTDEFVPPDLPTTGHGVSTVDKGMVIELDIMGTKVEVTNPDYIRELQRKLLDISTKLRTATQDINTLNSNYRKLANSINDLQRQLARKIDRD